MILVLLISTLTFEAISIEKPKHGILAEPLFEFAQSSETNGLSLHDLYEKFKADQTKKMFDDNDSYHADSPIERKLNDGYLNSVITKMNQEIYSRKTHSSLIKKMSPIVIKN